MLNAIKAGVQAGLEAMSKAPMSGIIKAGIFIGVAAFTCWVMVRRTKKMHDDANKKREKHASPVDEILGKSYATDPEAYDEMDPAAKKICKRLNRNWKKHIGRKGKDKKKPKSDNVRVVSLFDEKLDGEEDDEDTRTVHLFKDAAAMHQSDIDRKKKRRPNPEKIRKAKENARRKKHIDPGHMDQLRSICREWRDSGCVDSKTFKSRLDQIARELNLPVDDLDDAIDDTLREQCPSFF